MFDAPALKEMKRSAGQVRKIDNDTYVFINEYHISASKDSKPYVDCCMLNLKKDSFCEDYIMYLDEFIASKEVPILFNVRDLLELIIKFDKLNA